MKLFKLDATNSTNDYLKQLLKDIELSNWTVVTANYQTSGRGQMQSKWESEKGKNLMFSALIKLEGLKVSNQFYLNCAISLGIFNALKEFDLPNLKIKWPNDIMAANKKLGGILIENSLVNNNIYQSIVGVGLNINQNKFPSYLPKAISLNNILSKELDRNQILMAIIEELKIQISLLEQNKFDLLHKQYEQVLFKKGKPQMFVDQLKQNFVGKIIKVSKEGRLVVEKENGMVEEYNFKEVEFL